MNEPFDWGKGDEQFPTNDIDEWEFYITASGESGDSEVLQSRVSSELARSVDIVLQIAREKGIHLKTRSDFVRFAIFRAMGSLRAFLQLDQDESMSHFLVRQREAMRIAQQSEELKRIQGVVTQLLGGLQILTAKDNQDWSEAKERIVAFLVPVLQLAGEQDLLLKLYIRRLFGTASFVGILEQLKEHISLGPTIENAQRAYQRMLDERTS